MSKRRSTTAENSNERYQNDNEDYIENSFSPEHIYAEAESLTTNDTTTTRQEVVYVDPEGNVIKPERVVIVTGSNYNESSPNGMSSPGARPWGGNGHTAHPPAYHPPFAPTINSTGFYSPNEHSGNKIRKLDPNPNHNNEISSSSFNQNTTTISDKTDVRYIERNSQKNEIAPFILKLEKMINRSKDDTRFWTRDQQYPMIHWNSNGTTIVIRDGPGAFTKSIIPEHFNHTNYASFIRQLNQYDFSKRNLLKDDNLKSSKYRNEVVEFQNVYFQLNRRDQWHLIQRNKGQGKKKETEDAQRNVQVQEQQKEMDDLKGMVEDLKRQQNDTTRMLLQNQKNNNVLMQKNQELYNRDMYNKNCIFQMYSIIKNHLGPNVPHNLQAPPNPFEIGGHQHQKSITETSHSFEKPLTTTRMSTRSKSIRSKPTPTVEIEYVAESPTAQIQPLTSPMLRGNNKNSTVSKAGIASNKSDKQLVKQLTRSNKSTIQVPHGENDILQNIQKKQLATQQSIKDLARKLNTSRSFQKLKSQVSQRDENDAKRRKSGNDEEDDEQELDWNTGTPVPESGLNFDFPATDFLPNNEQLGFVDHIINNDLTGPLPRFESIRLGSWGEAEQGDDMLHNFFNGDSEDKLDLGKK